MAEYRFDAEKTRDILVQRIREFTESAGCARVVLGISGGKDSSVAAALCARALGPENVYGVMLPDGEQADIADSRRVCQCLGIRRRTVSIGAMHRDLLAAVEESGREPGAFPVEYHRESDINVGPRLRMTTLRYIAQAIGAFLCGTGNLSEATVGYCTKDGDTSCDFNPLGRLTSLEVVAVGLTMAELPRELVEKTPTDGLSGKSDEERLGVTYRQIHDFIRLGTSGDDDADARIAQKEKAGRHKRRLPTVLDPFE